MEHFDCVQILVTNEDKKADTYAGIYRGRGNWFGRQGMAREFIQQDQAQISANEISKALDDDSGEDWKP